MSTRLSPTQRAIVLEAAYDALAAARPGCFSSSEWHKPGGVSDLEKHLDPLIDIVRRTTAKRIEPFQIQILQDICDKCARENTGGTCNLRSAHQCLLYDHAAPLVEAISGALAEMRDPEFHEAHAHAGA